MVNHRFNSAKFFGKGTRRLMSSAKWWIIDFEKAPFKSLMYVRNNKGPNVEPSEHQKYFV